MRSERLGDRRREAVPQPQCRRPTTLEQGHAGVDHEGAGQLAEGAREVTWDRDGDTVAHQGKGGLKFIARPLVATKCFPHNCARMWEQTRVDHREGDDDEIWMR